MSPRWGFGCCECRSSINMPPRWAIRNLGQIGFSIHVTLLANKSVSTFLDRHYPKDDPDRLGTSRKIQSNWSAKYSPGGETPPLREDSFSMNEQSITPPHRRSSQCWRVACRRGGRIRFRLSQAPADGYAWIQLPFQR